MGHGPCWCSRHVHKMSMYCAGNYVISVASLLAANDRSKAWAISSERWDLSAKTGSSSEFYFISLFIILSCLAHRLIAAYPISLGPTLQTHYCKTEKTSVKHRYLQSITNTKLLLYCFENMSGPRINYQSYIALRTCLTFCL